TSGSVNDESGNVNLSGRRSASSTQYGLGKPDDVVAAEPQMVSWEWRRDTLRGNMLGRKMPGTASRCKSTREASCRTLSLIFGAPQSVGRPNLHGREVVHLRVNRLRGAMGQE